jgi:acetoin utilization protein AcuC
MTGKTVFVWSDHFLSYQFGPRHPFQPIRELRTIELLKGLGAFDERARLIELKRPASEEDLLLVHTKEYVDFVRRMCKKGNGFLDRGDTPASKGLYEAARWVVAGSVLCAELIMSGKALHAFNPSGGLHHAKPGAASGFCVFNDIAIVVRHLQRKHGIRRVAIIDIDGHHGDGTQEIFYNEPILKVSLHRQGIFPGTGWVDEIGEGLGRGFSVNLPLPAGTGDKAYLLAFEEIVLPLLRGYKPELILNQFGVDGHYQDPLVGLALTTHAYESIAKILHELAHELCKGRYLVLGGGGYNPRSTVRCWALMFLTVSQALPPSEYAHLHDKRQGEREMERVKKVIERVKRVIFPIHGMEAI